MCPGWFPDTLPSPNHSGVAVLSSISSCAPRSTFTFTVRVLCITHVSYTQIHPLHNQQALKLSHSHCHGIFKSVFVKMPLILNVKIILIGPVHIAHQSINLDISVGLATPLPDLCCQWSLLRHCNHHSMQCFVIQDTLRNSSFVLDIINISISKKNYPHHIPIPKNLFNHAMIYQWQKVMTKGHRYCPCNHHPPELPPKFFFSTWLISKWNQFFFQPAAKRDLGFTNQVEYVCHHLRATSPRTILDKMPSGTPRASLSRWTSSSFVSPLKRVPPLNCHVEISNGLSVPLSWNSWSRTSRNVSRGLNLSPKRSAPFWALLFSSLLKACSMFGSSIN